MARVVVPLLLIALLLQPAPTAAQSDDGCDLEFLTADFLHHFVDARSSDERLNLTFEYLNFVLLCTQEPDCSQLNRYYAKRFAAADSLDEMIVLNTRLTADLLICYDTPGGAIRDSDSDTLDEVFADLGFECDILDADPFYIHAECTGEHDTAIAQALYDATMDFFGVESALFDVVLSDDDSTTTYTYTGTDWLEPQKIPR